MIRSWQWRPEGLQRPGANAWIGAPPPRFGKSCIRPWEKSTPKKRKKKGLQPLLAIRPIKIRPYKLGWRPLQGLRPGAMAPLRPPRYATGSWTCFY